MPGHIPPDSGAPYIILCSGRIGVAIADNEKERIDAASQTAAKLTSYLQIRYRSVFNPADCVPTAEIQHDLMHHCTGEKKLSKDEVQAKIDALFTAMDALEHKYIGVAY